MELKKMFKSPTEMQNKAKRKTKNREKKQVKKRQNGRFSLNISIIVLNINGLNEAIK